MSTINYTFIIPHKNALVLLERCVKSIPYRTDIQVVVVDDNSSILDEDWCNFMKKFSYVELIKTNVCKSAGAVRNVGLATAKGKWVLFADCDDYYRNGFLEVLDKYIDKDEEVIYFNASGVGTSSIDDIHDIMIKCKKNPQKWSDIVRFKIRNPWMKMVKLNFLNKYNIKFEDIVLGNDIWYSIQVGYYVKKFMILDDVIYQYCYNQNSITYNRSIEKDVAEIEGYIKLNSFYNFIKHPEWHISFWGYIKWNLLNRSCPIMQAWAYLKNVFHFYKIRNLYINQLKSLW